MQITGSREGIEKSNRFRGKVNHHADPIRNPNERSPRLIHLAKRNQIPIVAVAKVVVLFLGQQAEAVLDRRERESNAHFRLWMYRLDDHFKVLCARNVLYVRHHYAYGVCLEAPHDKVVFVNCESLRRLLVLCPLGNPERDVGGGMYTDGVASIAKLPE